MEPCHAVVFIAAAATWIILVIVSPGSLRNSGRATYFVVQLESPVTVARTDVPSIYFPLLYVNSQLADEREQSLACIVSSTTLFVFVFAFRIQFAAATAALTYWLAPLDVFARYAESVRKRPAVIEFMLSSSTVGRQKTAPAFVTPLHEPFIAKFFTDVLPADAWAAVTWLHDGSAHVGMEEMGTY